MTTAAPKVTSTQDALTALDQIAKQLESFGQSASQLQPIADEIKNLPALLSQVEAVAGKALPLLEQAAPIILEIAKILVTKTP